MITTSTLYIYVYIYVCIYICIYSECIVTECQNEFYFLKWFILGRTGLTWTYRRPYARTRWQQWDSNLWLFDSWGLAPTHCAIGVDNWMSKECDNLPMDKHCNDVMWDMVVNNEWLGVMYKLYIHWRKYKDTHDYYMCLFLDISGHADINNDNIHQIYNDCILLYTIPIPCILLAFNNVYI